MMGNVAIMRILWESFAGSRMSSSTLCKSAPGSEAKKRGFALMGGSAGMPMVGKRWSSILCFIKPRFAETQTVPVERAVPTATIGMSSGLYSSISLYSFRKRIISKEIKANIFLFHPINRKSCINLGIFLSPVGNSISGVRTENERKNPVFSSAGLIEITGRPKKVANNMFFSGSH